MAAGHLEVLVISLDLRAFSFFGGGLSGTVVRNRWTWYIDGSLRASSQAPWLTVNSGLVLFPFYSFSLLPFKASKRFRGLQN